MGSTSIEDGVKGIEADLFSSPESPTTCDMGGKICTPISSSGGVRSFDLTWGFETASTKPPWFYPFTVYVLSAVDLYES